MGSASSFVVAVAGCLDARSTVLLRIFSLSIYLAAASTLSERFELLLAREQIVAAYGAQGDAIIITTTTTVVWYSIEWFSKAPYSAEYCAECCATNLTAYCAWKPQQQQYLWYHCHWGPRKCLASSSIERERVKAP